jgi:CubicO group peptidase (beta-lactamase class C family)
MAAQSILRSAIVDGLVVQRGGAIQSEGGDPSRPVLVRSVRKSILSLLYGIEVERGSVRLTDSLADLGIDDHDTLSVKESSATVEDLLMSRSGISHVAAAETETMKATRPARDTFGPGVTLTRFGGHLILA